MFAENIFILIAQFTVKHAEMRIHSTCLLPHDKLNSPVSKTHILRNANQMMKNAATIPINTPKVRIPRLRTVAPSLLFPASKIGNGQNTMDDVEPLFAVRGYLIH